MGVKQQTFTHLVPLSDNSYTLDTGNPLVTLSTTTPSIAPKTLNYLAFQSFDFERT